MAEFFASLSMLEWIYLALFCSALLYALFLAVFGFGHGHGLDHAGDLHGDLGHGVDFDHGIDLHHGVDFDHGVDLDHGVDFDHGVDVDHGVDLDHGVDVDHAADVHHDMDLDGGGDGGRHLQPLNPLVVAVSFAGFGGFGILGTRAFGLPSFLSLLVAVPVGLAMGGGMYFLYSRLLTMVDVDSSITRRDLFRIPAEVIIPVPEKGLGEIVYVAKGSRCSSPARSVDGRAIPKGSKVTILDTEGVVAIVDVRFAD